MATTRPDRVIRALAGRIARRHQRRILYSSMAPVEVGERAALRSFFLPEEPGPQTALQALREPRDLCLVDRWPEPRAVAVVAPGDMVLAGDPGVLKAAALRALAHRGMIAAPPAFEPVLRQAYPDLRIWPRVVYTLDGVASQSPPAGISIRPLGKADASLASTLHPEGKWLWKHYRGPAEMAASGLAWAAIAGEKCVSIALPYTRGESYEDLGAFTDPSFRGMGLSPACVEKVIEDVVRRGRIPSWSTSVDHQVSQRVAHKTGFQKDREDFVYITGPD